MTDKKIRNKLVAQVKKLAELKTKIQTAEEDLGRLTTVEAYLEQDLIPELMAELDMQEVKTGDVKVTLAKKVTASITEKNKEVAFVWFDENGEGGMVRRQIVVAFDRDQENMAHALAARLGQTYENVKTDCSVHNGTLAAWVRRRLKEGKKIPPCVSFIELPFAKIKIKE